MFIAFLTVKSILNSKTRTIQNYDWRKPFQFSCLKKDDIKVRGLVDRWRHLHMKKATVSEARHCCMTMTCGIFGFVYIIDEF